MHVCIPSAHQYVEEELPPQMFYWLGNGVPKLHVTPSGQSPTSWIIMQLATLPPFSKRKLFWTGHGLQRLTLTSYFYKNIYRKVIYYIFMKVFFLNKSIHIVFVF